MGHKADVNIHAPISVASPKWISTPTASNSDSKHELTSFSEIGTAPYEGQSRRCRVIKEETFPTCSERDIVNITCKNK